jgi:hypothetical protein
MKTTTRNKRGEIYEDRKKEKTKNPFYSTSEECLVVVDLVGVAVALHHHFELTPNKYEEERQQLAC